MLGVPSLPVGQCLRNLPGNLVRHPLKTRQSGLPLTWSHSRQACWIVKGTLGDRLDGQSHSMPVLLLTPWGSPPASPPVRGTSGCTHLAMHGCFCGPPPIVWTSCRVRRRLVVSAGKMSPWALSVALRSTVRNHALGIGLTRRWGSLQGG